MVTISTNGAMLISYISERHIFSVWGPNRWFGLYGSIFIAKHIVFDRKYTYQDSDYLFYRTETQSLSTLLGWWCDFVSLELTSFITTLYGMHTQNTIGVNFIFFHANVMFNHNPVSVYLSLSLSSMISFICNLSKIEINFKELLLYCSFKKPWPIFWFSI